MEKLNLNEMDKEIMKKYSDKFAFFKVENRIKSITDKNVYWLGKDYHEFFDVAVKAGVKMMYYYKTTFISMEGKFAEHNGDITELGFGFMHDGIMHILYESADWFNELLHPWVYDSPPEDD